MIDPDLYKAAMHGGQPQAKNFLKGGNGHGARCAGYGTMTIITLMGMLTWELAEDCGIEIENFNRDIAYDCIHTHTREDGYMGYRFATGAYPASHASRLSRTIRMPVRTIFIGHFARASTVGMRIERASTGAWISAADMVPRNQA